MASSSQNTFGGVDFEDFDQYVEQRFDQTFENLTIHQEEGKTSSHRKES